MTHFVDKPIARRGELTRSWGVETCKRHWGVFYAMVLGLAGPLAMAVTPGSEHVFWSAMVLLAAAVSCAESGLDEAPYKPAIAVLPLPIAAMVARSSATPFVLALTAVAIASCWAVRRERRRAAKQLGVSAAQPQYNTEYNTEQGERRAAQLLAEASHDLRQPVQALVAQVDLIGDNPSYIHARQFKEIHASVNTLAEMLNDLLDVNRVNLGIYQAALQPVNVQLLLKELRQVFAVKANAKGLRFLVECPNELWIQSDPRLLRRILFNLTANAIRYTDAGGIRISCVIAGGRVMLQAEDTGRGMKVEDLGAGSGEPRQRPTSSHRGLGLGLGIVSTMAHQLGHTLRAFSELGEGTQIEVDLGERVAAAYGAEQPGSAVLPLPSDILVAIVEDDPAVLKALANTFAGWGYRTVSAGSSQQLVAQLGHIGPAPTAPMLVITDYQLQANETGLDVIRTVRELYDSSKIPAVMLTGDVFAELEREAALAGIRVLYKPVRPSDLRKVVSELVFVNRQPDQVVQVARD